MATATEDHPDQDGKAMAGVPATVDLERLAAQMDESARYMEQAARRIKAGTRTLDALSALARSWEDQARQCCGPATAETLRKCAAQLRKTVRQAHKLITEAKEG